MKKLFIILMSFTIVTLSTAQGKSGDKGKKSESKHYKQSKKSHEKYEKDDDWQRKDGDYKKTAKNYSKNQPAKVRAAFESDYPQATNVRWTKSRGDWTVTFTNGLFNRKNKVTYHANGEKQIEYNRNGKSTKRPIF